MISDSLKKKLDGMVGGTYLYNTREVTIKGINSVNGQVRFVNDGNPILINKSELGDKIDDFLPVEVQDTEETLPAKMEGDVEQTFNQTDETIEKLENIILHNIEKVQNEKDYLPQAKQVNRDVNTILKMKQQKIDLFREMRKTKLNIKK